MQILANPLHESRRDLNNAISDTNKKVIKLPIQYRKQRKFVTLPNSNYGKVALLTKNYEWLAAIDVGTPGQTLNLIVDSGSPETWLVTTSCESCTSGNFYDPNESSTFVYNGSEFAMTYIGGNGPKGYFGSDVVNIGGILVENQTMGLITYSNILVDSDGLLAIGLSASSDYGSTTVFDNMISRGLISEPVYTVKLIKDSQSNAGGEITFGEIDYSEIDGEITYSYLTEDEHWQITVTNVYFDNIPLNLNQSVTYPVAFDTGSQQIMIDGSITEYIISQIPGAAFSMSTEIRDGADVSIYTVPCNTDTTLGPLEFVIEGRRFLMPIKDLILDPLDDDQDTCSFGITGCSSHTVSWIFGAIFIKNYFVIFDQSTSPPRLGVANRYDVVYE
ncbi:7212_t:CDS:2 [Acaulospora morrowiae]|uniref:7212_t:CDS:1 n=1 Tax=Acaulospora morrowiae TaxID=94023 RepID=A0A9N9C2F2_9GLOM|nr:7212_t:CDS:2 [Acaulospora morrowiae]